MHRRIMSEKGCLVHEDAQPARRQLLSKCQKLLAGLLLLCSMGELPFGPTSKQTPGLVRRSVFNAGRDVKVFSEVNSLDHLSQALRASDSQVNMSIQEDSRRFLHETLTRLDSVAAHNLSFIRLLGGNSAGLSGGQETRVRSKDEWRNVPRTPE